MLAGVLLSNKSCSLTEVSVRTDAYIAIGIKNKLLNRSNKPDNLNVFRFQLFTPTDNVVLVVE